MCLYPDVMRKAQTQIDQVVGRDRLPTFADFDNLHYIRAIVKEVLRWRPVGPLGMIIVEFMRFMEGLIHRDILV